MHKNLSDMQFNPPMPPMMIEITLHEYSQLNRQVGFLEGTLSGLNYCTDDWPMAVSDAIDRYSRMFIETAIENPPAIDRSPAL